MSDNTEVSYKDYYLNTIQQQLQKDDFNGFKPVIGPTGMGKTSRIPAVIDKIREMEIDKSCIYTSHRHLLIEEMEAELADKNIPSVYLKSNEDVIRDFIKNENRDSFLLGLDEDGFFEDYAGTSLRETQKLIRQIEKLIQSSNNISKGEAIAINLVQEKLRGQCSILLKIFKNGLVNMPLKKKESLLTTKSLFWVLFPYAQFLGSVPRLP